jgi:uncharacterized membrane protein YcaP (DUF421 family)
LSQLSPFNLVSLLIISEIVSPALTAGDESLTGAMIGAVTLFLLTYLESQFSYLSKFFRQITESPATLLVRRGKLIEDALHRERIPTDELYAEMHKSGIDELSQVKWALLESDGKMSFVRMDNEEILPKDEASVAT